MQNTKRTNSNWISGLFIGVVFIALSILVFLLFLGLRGYQDSSKKIISESAPDAIGTYQYSEEQNTAITQFGSPAYFSIQFYDDWLDNGNLQTIRAENWGFERHGQELSYFNGALIDSFGIDIPAQTSLPLTFSPNQFNAYMRLEEISAITGVTEFIEVPIETELLPGGKIYFGPGIAIGFKNDQLIYVETFSQIDLGDQS